MNHPNLVPIGNTAVAPDNVALVTLDGSDVRVDFKADVGDRIACMLFHFADAPAAKAAGVRFIEACNAALTAARCPQST